MKATFIHKDDTIYVYPGLDPEIVDDMEADGFLRGHNLSIDFEDMFDYQVKVGNYGYDSLVLAMVYNQRMNEIVRDNWDLRPSEISFIDSIIDFNSTGSHKYYVDDKEGILAYLNKGKNTLYITTKKGYADRFEANLVNVGQDEYSSRRPMKELLEDVSKEGLEIKTSQECNQKTIDFVMQFITHKTIADFIDEIDYLINTGEGITLGKEYLTDNASNFKYIGGGKFKDSNFCFQAVKKVTEL